MTFVEMHFLLFAAFHIFGSSGKLMVELCVIGYLMGTCITYFVVLGDLGPQITAKLFNLNPSDTLRYVYMFFTRSFHKFAKQTQIIVIFQNMGHDCRYNCLYHSAGPVEKY